MILFLIFFVFIILYLSSSTNQNKTKNTSTYINQNKTNSSYYSPKKVASYQKMNMDHQNHGPNIHKEDDPCKEIGYKKCPKCQNTVSKKSEVCFMCDYVFERRNS